MSKRLQVILSDQEAVSLQAEAEKEHMTTSDLVRKALKAYRLQNREKTAEDQKRSLRKAMQNSFPTCDIEQMNAEIEQGYLSGLP